MTAPLIVGAGVAGLAAALAAPRPVTLITAATLDEGAASLWSQGGIAAATAADDDTRLHAADTIAAGAGLCDEDAVSRIIGDGPRVIERLRDLGVAFDDGPGLEAAHSRRRIHHVRDRTGLAIMAAMVRAVRAAPHVTVMERCRARELVLTDGAVRGLRVERDGRLDYLPSAAVLIATGGVGGLFPHTTNPPGATGSGLALAARAGAVLRDLEFVQFHPTGLDAGGPRMMLISEAVRGEGAVLVDETGTRFTDELAPRDVVARAVFRHLSAGHQVALDATHLGPRFADRFPAINAACLAAGIDPSRQAMPVSPAAHYHMGGIAVDAEGRSTVPGLFAAGEAACTGLHGANRLASNSLLEAFVTGERAGAALDIPERAHAAAPEPASGARSDLPAPTRALIGRHLGLLRDAAGLAALAAHLAPLAPGNDEAMIAMMMTIAALDRAESRGAHARTDARRTASRAVHSNLTLPQALDRAAHLQTIRHAA